MTGPGPYTAHDVEAIIVILIAVTVLAAALMKRATRPRRSVAPTSRRGKVKVRIGHGYTPEDIERMNMTRWVPARAPRHRDIRHHGVRLK